MIRFLALNLLLGAIIMLLGEIINSILVYRFGSTKVNAFNNTLRDRLISCSVDHLPITKVMANELADIGEKKTFKDEMKLFLLSSIPLLNIWAFYCKVVKLFKSLTCKTFEDVCKEEV